MPAVNGHGCGYEGQQERKVVRHLRGSWAWLSKVLFMVVSQREYGDMEIDTSEIPDRGIYVLLLRVPEGRPIRVGSRGSVALQRGYYAYVGRAKRGLRARLARHARKEGKRLRWHIDYLMDIALLEEVWLLPLHAGECETASMLEQWGASREGLRGFGSGDCRCPGHLLHLGEEKPKKPLCVSLVIETRDEAPR